MSTATTPATALDTKQRDWLKKMGASLQTGSTAGTPDKAIVGSIFDVVPDPINTTVTIKNNSPFILQIVPKSAKPESPPSDFVKAPPLEIAANRGEATFTLSNKLLGKIPSPGGTGGQVQYDVVGDPKRTRLFFKWERGFLFPSRETTQTVTPKDDSKFKIEGFNSGGDDFAFIFTAVGDVPPVPPGPNPGPAPKGVDIASSCLITITNNSKSVLTLLDPKPVTGNFLTFPPNSIAPGTSASVVYVETPNNTNPKDEGCKGGVLWEVGSPKICTCLMEWDNPEGAQNTVKATFQPDGTGFRCIKQIGQADENVPVSFTVTGDGGGVQPPPTPTTTTGKLLVTVTEDTTSKPIDGATVAVAGKTAKTDKAGKTDFDVPAGDQQLVVTADGFEEGRAGATVKSGEKTDVAVFMKKKQAAADFKEPVESKQPTLRPGDESADGWIEFLQSLLVKQLGDAAKQEINGKYDKKTEVNVRKFQADHKPKPLQVDGVVGNQTWAALRKAPDEAVGTDGRKPHTFVEKGPEARWVCEQTDFEIKIDPKKDTVTMSLASVGTEPVDKFQATIFVTPEGGKKTQLPPFTIGAPTLKRDSGSGDIHQVVLTSFAKTFGKGTHTIQGFLPQELGGDKFEDKVVIS